MASPTTTSASTPVSVVYRSRGGLLLVVPVAQVKGLHKTRHRQPATPAPLPAAVQPDWVVRRDTPVAKVLPILALEPAVVRPDTPLAHACVHRAPPGR